MALLTESTELARAYSTLLGTESALTEAGNSVLMASVFHGLWRILASASAYSTLLGILRLQG